jgi:membrane-anchored mycosin MYCP
LATRKDQLDAFVFARRRIVANLVAPSATGSDESAPRPMKTFVTSAVLSALAVAVVAVLGVFKPSAPGGWENGLAVDATSGAAYVYSTQDHELHPMLNITSARLILGANFQKFDVPDSVINSVTMGVPYGIAGAPPDVPTAGSVDLTSWTLCVQQAAAAADADQSAPAGTTTLEVGYGRGALSVLAPPTADDPINLSSALIVHDSQNLNYLIDGDYAYQIGDVQTVAAITRYPAPADGLVGPWVSGGWLDAFASGDPIDFPSIQGLGRPLPPGLTGQPGRVVGQYGLGPDGQDGYIETRTGLVEVDPFVYQLYAGSLAAAKVAAFPAPLTPAAVNEANATNQSAAGAATSLTGVGGDWPTAPPTVRDFDGTDPAYRTLCANYNGSFDQNVAHLEVWHGMNLPHPLAADEGVAQSGGDQLADVVDVLAGHGAYGRDVSGGDSQNSGALYLTVDTGSRYQLMTNVSIPGVDGGQPTETSAAQMLQYSSLTPEPVPDSWMRLLQAGADLDPSIAGTTPTLTATTTGVAGLADLSTCTTQSSNVSRIPDQSGTPWEIAHANPAELQSGVSPDTGEGVKVAVVDTGIAGTNPQLRGAVMGGRDFTGSGGDYEADSDGHGTFVASIIAAKPSAHDGMAGIAPGVGLLVYREAGCDVPAGGNEDSMAAAVNQAVRDGARVINISQDGYQADSKLRAAVMNAYEKNVVIVTSAGNYGDSDAQTQDASGKTVDYGTDPVIYPASYAPYVLAVGAVDQNSAVAPWSETGGYVGVTAPGVGVGGLLPDGAEYTDDGTSFSAPYVAAVAALVISKHPTLSAETVIKVLEATAGDGSGMHWTASDGWGEVNPAAAIAADPESLPRLYGAGPNADGPAAAAPLVRGDSMRPLLSEPTSKTVLDQREGARITFVLAFLVVVAAFAGRLVARDARRGREASRSAAAYAPIPVSRSAPRSGPPSSR